MKTGMSKRKKRRLRGREKEKRRVSVHYFCYYGFYRYSPAALTYLSGNALASAREDMDWLELNFNRFGYIKERINKCVITFRVDFPTIEEAICHVTERKLGMLPNDKFETWRLLSYVPYKITETYYGKDKHKHVVTVVDLGTR